jgi:hypothetical protein
MLRYWDHSERERAALTAEQVEALMTVELMEKGVTKVEPPTLEAVDDVALPSDQFFQVLREGPYSSDTAFDCLFDTLEQAQAFIDLTPRFRNHDYSIGRKYDFAKVATGLKIGTVKMCREQDVVNVKARLEKAAATKSANEKSQREYNDAIREVTKATQGVWEDWRNMRNTEAVNQRVIDTYREYVKTCDGNEKMAMTFLGKAFSEGKIVDAFEWFGMELEQVEEVAAAD